MTYNTVLGIKTNRIKFFCPKLVADVLRELDRSLAISNLQEKEDRRKETDKEKIKENRKKETVAIVRN